MTLISIHALREEGDLRKFGQKIFIHGFLSTPSARRATNCRYAIHDDWQISIHALREEGDLRVFHIRLGTLRNFYPRPPRGGRREYNIWNMLTSSISIHALREEGDVYVSHGSPRCIDFYPRPPRGGRQGHLKRKAAFRRFLSTPSARRATGNTSIFRTDQMISIHALREEGDTMPCVLRLSWCPISIHALREEGDSSATPNSAAARNFYPRPPRGGRR